MTPERAAYHRLMLLAGAGEEYERELDLALETEDPITSPILDLALCISDLNKTISVLNHYILGCPVDEQQVHDMIMAELRRRYVSREMNAEAVCEVLSRIWQVCDFSDPWIDLYTYLYEYELLDEGLISRQVFEIGFESVFLHGERTDVWALQKECNQKKKKSPWDFLRKRK